MTPPRVAVLMCFYDEDPSLLVQSVSSAALVGDALVALDGAYVDFECGSTCSHADQRAAVLQTGSAAGMDMIYEHPAVLWPDEMTKRTALFALAERTGAEWYIVLDADEVVIAVPRDFRQRLADATVDVFEVPFLDAPAAGLTAYAEDADGEPFIARARHVKYRRTIFRGSSPITVAGRHSRYFTGDRCLWGDPAWGDEPVEAERMRDFVFDHRSHLRDGVRNERRKRYYRDRDEKQLETIPA